MKNDLYYTDELQFVALAILLNKCQVKDVVFKDKSSWKKLYGLSPKKEAETLYLQYVSDKLKISPQILSLKVSSVRYLPARIPEEVGSKEEEK